MKRNGLFRMFVVAMLAVAVGTTTAMAQAAPPPPPPEAQAAQGQDAQNPAQNPPGRVARLAYMSGQISIQPGGVDDWIAASQNRPLTSADRIWTDKQARAELTLGTAALRMNSETSLTLTNVGDRSVQLQLDQGTLSVTVFRLFPGEIYEVDTPNTAFTITKVGEYRFDVLPDNDQTWVTVRKGQGEATGQGQAVRVNSGEQVRFTNGTSMVHTAEAAPQRDGFEDWVKVRNKREEGSVSARYVAPGTVGYEDLDSNGTWSVAPAYGPVWYPSGVPVGWAPYRYGHWVWVAPWGWTWVDDAPWGFAPFHYGRWVSYGGRWGWCPGPVVVGVRPVYAPALVAWFGGPRFGVSIGFGGVGVGWFPLGWGEPFRPWYHYGPGYFRSVNITNTRITNINVVNVHYANRTFVTAAPASGFVAGRAMHPVAVQSAMLRNGEVMRTAQVAPVRESVLGGHAPMTRGVPPARAFSRPVVTHQAPPPRPPSFQSQQPLLAKNNGMPLNQQAMNSLRQPQGQNVNRGPAAQPTPNRGGAPGQAGGRNVPRPPNAGGGTATTANRTSPAMNGRVVPRPPQSGAGTTGRAAPQTNRTVPRPPDRGNQAAVNSRGAVNGANQGAVNSRNTPNNSTNRSYGGRANTTPSVRTPEASHGANPENHGGSGRGGSEARPSGGEGGGARNGGGGGPRGAFAPQRPAQSYGHSAAGRGYESHGSQAARGGQGGGGGHAGGGRRG